MLFSRRVLAETTVLFFDPSGCTVLMIKSDKERPLTTGTLLLSPRVVVTAAGYFMVAGCSLAGGFLWLSWRAPLSTPGSLLHRVLCIFISAERLLVFPAAERVLERAPEVRRKVGRRLIILFF